MMWPEVFERAVALVRSDAALVGIYGANVRMAGSGVQQVPGLEYTLIGDTETELWAPMTVQFDQWVKTPTELQQSERRLRALFNRQLPITLNGVQMWAQYEDGAVLAMPERSGFYGRASRFRLTPLRQQYAQPQPHGVTLLPDRSVRTFTTEVLPDGGAESSAVSLADGAVLYEITASHPCRIVFYSTPEAREADVDRPSGIPPEPGTGVLAEFEFFQPSTVECGPLPFLGNAESIDNSNIYYTLTNASGADVAITISVVYVPFER